MAQSSRLGTGQVSVASTATLIVPANENRLDLRLTKLSVPNVYLGCDASVTITSGAVFAGTCGTTIQLTTTGAGWGITTGAASSVTFLEITQ